MSIWRGGNNKDSLARLEQQVNDLSAELAAVRGQYSELRKHLTEVEWVLKLAPAGIPMAGGRIITKTVHGALLYVNADDRLMAPHLLTERAFEPDVSSFIWRNLNHGDAAIDVGANLGYYSCMMGLKVKSAGRVWAYEADPVTCVLLNDNIWVNAIQPWVHFQNVAIAGGPGKLRLYRRQRYQGNTSIIRVEPELLTLLDDADEEFSVDCDSLDRLFASVDRPISIIKIDVEGSEAAVLEGMVDLVKRNPQVKIVLEWALWTIRGAGGTPERMMELIAQMGLETWVIEQTLRRIELEELRHTEIAYLALAKPGVLG